MFLPTNITLKFGDSGDFVSELQRRLSVVKCFDEAAINGFFDGVTVNGVSQFQSLSGIQADGIAGPETLRRLNGAISGDFATNDHEAEAKRREEQAQLLLQQQREQAYREEQALLAQQQQERAYQQQMQQQATATPETYAQPAQPQYQPQAQPQIYAPPAAQPYIPPQAVMMDQLQPQQGPQTHQAQQAYTAQQQPQQPAQAAQPAAPTAGDLLAQMLLSSQQQAPQAQQQRAAAPQQPTAQPPIANAPAQAEAYAAPQQAVAEAPRGMVGRAVQYANQVIQKLATYFEEKLPNHVINEVKEIGQTMAKAGMKEAPIAGAAQEQQRGVDAPGKSQQQGKQLG